MWNVQQENEYLQEDEGWKGDHQAVLTSSSQHVCMPMLHLSSADMYFTTGMKFQCISLAISSCHFIFFMFVPCALFPIITHFICWPRESKSESLTSVPKGQIPQVSAGMELRSCRDDWI